MNPYWDAILFDFDGVLADTEPLHYACWKEILEDFGIELDREYYFNNCVGTSDRFMIAQLAAQRVPPVAFEQLWAESERKRLMFFERIMAAPPFLPETVTLINKLSGFYRLAVVSSSGRSEVEPPIESAGIRACFAALVCGREVANLKPAPDPYLKAAELVGAKRPLVVEDSDAGIASAVAAGFDVVRIPSPETVAAEVWSRLRTRI